MNSQLRMKMNYVIDELHKLNYYNTSGLSYMKLKIRLALEQIKRDLA